MMFFNLSTVLIALGSSIVLSGAIAAPVEGESSTSDNILEKRENYFTGCTPAQEKIIFDALGWAWSDIVDANNRIVQVTNPPTNRESSAIYKAHFGEYTKARHDKVARNLLITKDHLFRYHYRLDCRCKEDTATIPDVNKAGNIKICKRFWTAPPRWSTATSLSQPTLLRSDFFRFKYNAGTQDIARGIQGVWDLAKWSPDKAVNNADSYALFCERSLFHDQ